MVCISVYKDGMLKFESTALPKSVCSLHILVRVGEYVHIKEHKSFLRSGLHAHVQSSTSVGVGI